MDHAFQAETPQVIRHLRVRIGPPEERFDLRPEIPVPESVGQMGKAGDRLQERHDARVAETQG